MTLLQKINNLTWWNELGKLKDILKTFNTRVSTIEDTPTVSGSFIPLSGTEVGSEASGYITYTNDISPAGIVKVSTDGGTITSVQLGGSSLQNGVYNIVDTTNRTVITQTTESASIYQQDSNVQRAELIIKYGDSQFSDTDPTSRGLKGAQDFTANLTDLDFVQYKLLPKVAGDYADDAAAATGGIEVGGLYHTAGSVKIRLV